MSGLVETGEIRSTFASSVIGAAARVSPEHDRPTEDDFYFVDIDEFLRSRCRSGGIAFIIFYYEFQLSTVNAAGVVNLLLRHPYSPQGFYSPCSCVASQREHYANADYIIIIGRRWRVAYSLYHP